MNIGKKIGQSYCKNIGLQFFSEHSIERSQYLKMRYDLIVTKSLCSY